MSANRASVEVTTPGRSIRWGALGSRDSEITLAPSSMVTRPTGTFTKKIHSQLRYWVSRPPISGPTASANAPTALQMPIAAARRRPASKVAEMMASVVGVSSAAPRPWMARAAISPPAVVASPAASEAPVKIASPVRNTRLRPQTSASRPPASSRLANTRMYPLTTHSRPEVVRCRSRCTAGMATFTTLLSR